MSLKYRDYQGNETPISGLNGTSGELVPSVALQQSGRTGDITCSGFNYASVQITFVTPMPDANYEIIYNADNLVSFACCSARNKTAQGFMLYVYNPNETELTGNISWTAFKLMTDTVHEADASAIAQNTANFAPAFSEVTSYAVGDYCTYNNVLYRCTTAHTAGVWVAGHFTAVTVGGDLSAIVPSDASASNKLVSNNTLNEWKGVNDTSSAYKLTRTAVKGGCALFSDVFGNTYMVSSGDQSSRFSVRQINVVGNTDSSKYWNGNEVCYISAVTFALTLIAVFGSLDYEAIPSHISTAPSGTTEYDISTSIPINTVTSGSTAPITSGGVYDALKNTFALTRVDEHTCTLDLSLLPYAENGLCLISLMGDSNLEGSAVCSIGYFNNEWRINSVTTLVDAGNVGTITASISGSTLTVSNTGVHYSGRLSIRVGLGNYFNV